MRWSESCSSKWLGSNPPLPTVLATSCDTFLPRFPEAYARFCCKQKEYDHVDHQLAFLEARGNDRKQAPFPAQSTISNQTLYTDKLLQLFSRSDLQGRSLLDRVTAITCSTPYCYDPAGKLLNAFHHPPPRKHSDVSDSRRLQSHSSSSLQGKRAFPPTSYRYTCPW